MITPAHLTGWQRFRIAGVFLLFLPLFAVALILAIGYDISRGRFQ